MCAAFGSALGKEKIKMKKEVVKIKKIYIYILTAFYNTTVGILLTKR